MIEKQVEVVTIGPGYATVKNVSSGCSHCKSSCPCTQLTRSTPKAMHVHNPLYAQPGDIVIIGIKANSLLKNAFLVYLAPLLAMIFMALLGDVLFSMLDLKSEVGSITFGLTGLMAALFFSRYLLDSTQKTADIRPVILRHARTEIKPVHFAHTV